MDIKYILDVMESGQNVDHCDVRELVAENARLQSIIDEANEWKPSLNNVCHNTFPAQQSPAVAVPELDYVDGDILPPVGASVAIHLASCDKWVDHTVVGYYVWGPLGGIDSAYSRVFVRVLDDQGILNARLLKDVKWDKNTPARQIQSPRITEQDSLPGGYQEEWKRNVMLMWSCVRKYDSSIPSDVLDYMREQLLNKLNEVNHAR